MREAASFRLGVALFSFLIAIPISFLWLQADLVSSNRLGALGKLFVVDLLAATAAVFFIFTLLESWRRSCRQLERLVTSLPAGGPPPVLTGAPEMVAVGRSLGQMSARVRHITERSNLEVSRRETILACMAEGVLAVDKDLKVTFCNEAFAQAFSTRIPTSEGRQLFEVVREPVFSEILQRVVSTGAPETDRFQLPSAAGRWFEARALPFGSQPAQGAVIVLHDITDLERQERVRKDFVADVSHEFRTPIAAIRGYAETLLDGALEDGENSRRFVEIIQSHATRLSNIASDLLVISELDAHAAPKVPPEPVSVLEVIQSALLSVEANAASRDIRLDMSGCRPCTVIGYRFRLEQVFTNLIDNAVKFNKPQGEVMLQCGPDDDRTVLISVADTGIGIPADEVKRVFERFYRVDKARSRPTGGTGLGLSIVKEVIEGMGGTVGVETQLGRGTKFSVRLKSA